MKTTCWTLLICILMSYPTTGIKAEEAEPTTTIKDYSDVASNDWYYNYLYVVDQYVSGYPDGTFKANNDITVAEFLTLLMRADSINVIIANENPWYRYIVQDALTEGVIIEGEFPDYSRQITRSEIARILIRVFRSRYTDSEQLAYEQVPVPFQDVEEAADYDFINEAFCRGLITGYQDSTFRPDEKATRAESLVMLARYLDETYRVIPEWKVHVRDDGHDRVTIEMTMKEGRRVKVSLDYGGVNEIYGISSITYPDHQLYMLAGTDFVGPYIMRSADEEQTVQERFTGGWHGSNGDGTGSPTGYTESIEFYVDGVAEDTIHSGAVTDLHIRVTNRIKGYSSDDYIIREVVDYRISRSTIDVEVEITGLTDLVIERYYGLQTKNKLWSEIDYGGSVSPLTQYSEGKTVREYSLVNGSGLILTAGVHPGGLGDFVYRSESKPNCFSQDYGKAYFNLVNGIELTIGEGESVEWSGFYRFSRESL